MTKWVENKEVVFTCQRDIFEYLLDNKHGVYHSKDTAKKINHFEHGYFGVYSLDRHTDWVPMKRAEWYEDIPEQGVLGWAYDNENDNYITVAVSYDKAGNYPFKCQNRCGYKNFVPFTKEEVLQYILPE